MRVPYRTGSLPESLFPLNYTSPVPTDEQVKYFFQLPAVQEILHLLRGVQSGMGLTKDFPRLPRKLESSLLARMLCHAKTIAIVQVGLGANLSKRLEQAIGFLDTLDYEGFVIQEHIATWNHFVGHVDQAMHTPDWRVTLSEYLGGQKFYLGVNLSAMVRAMVKIRQQTGSLKLLDR